MPSRDVAADRTYLTDVLGGRMVLALYQLTRPEVASHCNGRRDF